MSEEHISQTEEIPSGLVDVQELASWLRIGRSTLYRFMQAGLPYLQVGGRRKFRAREVLDWLNGEEPPTENGTEEADSLLEPGDYRCLGCSYEAHLPRPYPSNQLRCPRCGSLGRVERTG